ncbi:hypothetical protein E4U52_002699 [Claviceps spartinae]|nr:hypothetical protein E4U52_002699 [Claviceps spartinae]
MSVDIATPEAGSTTGGLTRNATLKSGQRFVLFDKESGKAVVAVGQNVVFQACDDMSVVHSMWPWHWDCVVAKGWVSLRNRISEYYLGPDYERLVVGPISGRFTGHLVVKGRGQTLSAPYGEYMFQIVRGKTPQTLAMATTEGVEWEFIRVESQ